MTERRKIQHYIPKFYLREFSRENKNRSQIFCFDKKTGAIFSVAIDKIGAESYFNDVDDEQKIEQLFSELEDVMSKSYHVLLESENVNKLLRSHRILIALLIATQHLRTRKFRNSIKEAAEYTLRQTRDLHIISTESQSLSQLAKLTEEESAKHFQFTLLARSVREFVALLLQMKWVLLFNETKSPFWCSDSPFTYSNAFRYDKYDGLGFERVGSQTHFPLNPRLSLEIVDPLTYIDHPDIIHIDDPKNIIFNNHLQVKKAQRYIFSPTDDFSLAEEMIRRNPRLRETDRNRFEIQKPKSFGDAPYRCNTVSSSRTLKFERKLQNRSEKRDREP